MRLAKQADLATSQSYILVAKQHTGSFAMLDGLDDHKKPHTARPAGAVAIAVAEFAMITA